MVLSPIDLCTLYGSQEPKASLIVLGHTRSTHISKNIKPNSIIPILDNQLKLLMVKKVFVNNKETFECVGIDKNTNFIIKPSYEFHKSQANALTRLIVQKSLIILAGNSPNPVVQNALVQSNEIIHLYTFNMYQLLSYLRIKQLRNSKASNPNPFDNLAKDKFKKVLVVNDLDYIYDDCFEYDHFERARVIKDFVKQLEMVDASIILTCKDYKMFKDKLERFFVNFAFHEDELNLAEQFNVIDGEYEEKETLPKGSTFSSHQSHLQEYLDSEYVYRTSQNIINFSRGRSHEAIGSKIEIVQDDLEIIQSETSESENIKSSQSIKSSASETSYQDKDRAESETSTRPKGSALNNSAKYPSKIISSQLKYIILPQYIELQEINEIIKTCFLLELNVALDQGFIDYIAKVLVVN